METFQNLLLVLEAKEHVNPIKIEVHNDILSCFHGKGKQQEYFLHTTKCSIETTWISGRRKYILTSNNKNFVKDLRSWFDWYFNSKISVNEEEQNNDIMKQPRRSTRSRKEYKKHGSQITQFSAIMVKRRKIIQSKDSEGDGDFKEDNIDDNIFDVDDEMETEEKEQSLNECIGAVFRGENVQISGPHEHPDMKTLSKEFIRRCEMELYYCNFCKERWFEENIRNKVLPYICQSCKKTQIYIHSTTTWTHYIQMTQISILHFKMNIPNY